MNRSYSTPAIIFSLRPLGENNSSVTILTPGSGISYATLYGGPKSKMKSLVSQWNSGIIWLYDNPEKKQTKISDFEVKNYHTTFTESLYKLYAASLAAELAIKTKCAGSNEQCFRLISGFLDGMDLCNEDQSRVGLIRFLWRYLELLGIQPSAHCCGQCGKSFLEQKFVSESLSYYNSNDNSFICTDCGKGQFPIKTSALQYLSAVSVLPPSQVRKLQIDKEGYNQIRDIVFFLIENSVEQRLNTIETGLGIL